MWGGKTVAKVHKGQINRVLKSIIKGLDIRGTWWLSRKFWLRSWSWGYEIEAHMGLCAEHSLLGILSLFLALPLYPSPYSVSLSLSCEKINKIFF